MNIYLLAWFEASGQDEPRAASLPSTPLHRPAQKPAPAEQISNIKNAVEASSLQRKIKSQEQTITSLQDELRKVSQLNEVLRSELLEAEKQSNNTNEEQKQVIDELSLTNKKQRIGATVFLHWTRQRHMALQDKNEKLVEEMDEGALSESGQICMLKVNYFTKQIEKHKPLAFVL